MRASIPMKRCWLAVFLALGAAGLLASACTGDGGAGSSSGPNPDGGSGAGDSGSPAPPIVGDGAGGPAGEGTGQGFVTDYCNLLGQCCSQSGVSFRGPQECVTQLTNVYLSSTQYMESIGGLGEGIVYSPAAGQACIQALGHAGVESGCLAAYADNPSCANVFACSTLTGTKAAGDTCACDAECIAPSGGRVICYGSVIASDGGVRTTGTCVQLTPGTAGQGPCLVTVDPAGTGTNRWMGAGPVPPQAHLCDSSSGVWCNASTQQCAARGGTGQTCTQDRDCVAADYCPTGAGPTSTCAPRIADGASCSGATQACQAASYCDSTSKLCQPLLADGAACKTGTQCSGGQCNLASGSSSGTCGTRVPGSGICLL
jgi:hypothetical protein